MTHPIDALYPDGASVVKTNVRAHHKARIPLVVDLIDDIQATDYGAAKVIYVAETRALYQYNSADTTSADDGDLIIVDPAGRRYELAVEPSAGRGVTAPGGRLSASSSLSLPVDDTTTAGSLFYLPHASANMPIYTGTKWRDRSIGSGLSVALNNTTKNPAAAVLNSIYDWFVWDDAGTLRLSHGPAWSSATARPTGPGTSEIERVGGLYVNKYAITNACAANRGTWVGTTRTNASVEIPDTQSKRLLWNAYNRVARSLFKAYNAANWSYTSATIRQANADAAHQIETLCGLAAGAINLSLECNAGNSTSTARAALIGIGLNSTTAFLTAARGRATVTDTLTMEMHGRHVAELPVGYSYWTMLEAAAGTDTQTFNGTTHNSSGFWGSAEF
jgi:hypothetical protein